MWSSNNALIPDPDKEPGQLESQPYHWPFMLRGLRMCGWGDSEIKYYLLGSPLIWWGSTVSLFLLPLTIMFYHIRSKRGYFDFTQENWDDYLFASKVGLLGWFLHYIPFYIMGRVMYVHHYFPALYFAMISFVVLLDQLQKRLPKLVGTSLMIITAIAFIASFLFFADFAFGMEGPANQWANRQWLSQWNIF
jgi:dolichyl-phosphate-mannose-protein mannosyltransferase